MTELPQSAAENLRFLRNVCGFSAVTQELDFGRGLSRFIAVGWPDAQSESGEVGDLLSIELRLPLSQRLPE